MPPLPRDPGLNARFLEELSETLDIERTIQKLHITREDARAILKGLMPRKKAEQAGLFERPAVHKAGLYRINVDGASRGNPGKAGAGAVFTDPHGRVVRKFKKYLGITTNNMAEYQALIMALEAAAAMGLEKVEVLADSELMVKQVNGAYKVKSEDLKPLFQKAATLSGRFKEFTISHVYREENSLADAMANEAIDSPQ